MPTAQTALFPRISFQLLARTGILKIYGMWWHENSEYSEHYQVKTSNGILIAPTRGWVVPHHLRSDKT